MDKIDKKIITLLQQNARMPLKALAENVFLLSSSIRVTVLFSLLLYIIFVRVEKILKPLLAERRHYGE